MGSGKVAGQGGGDICIRIADSCFCTAEMNTILLSSYIPIKTTKQINAVMSFISLSPHTSQNDHHKKEKIYK